MSDPYCASRCSALCAPGEPCFITEDGRCAKRAASSDDLLDPRAALDELSRIDRELFGDG